MSLFILIWFQFYRFNNLSKPVLTLVLLSMIVFAFTNFWIFNGYFTNYWTNTRHVCTYKCISYGGFKYGHEIPKRWRLLQLLSDVWPVVCSRLSRGKGTVWSIRKLNLKPNNALACRVEREPPGRSENTTSNLTMQTAGGGLLSFRVLSYYGLSGWSQWKLGCLYKIKILPDNHRCALQP